MFLLQVLATSPVLIDSWQMFLRRIFKSWGSVTRLSTISYCSSNVLPTSKFVLVKRLYHQSGPQFEKLIGLTGQKLSRRPVRKRPGSQESDQVNNQSITSPTGHSHMEPNSFCASDMWKSQCCIISQIGRASCRERV